MRRPVAIVDPYSGGSMLASGFHKVGRDCVMVQTTETVPPQFRRSVRESDFVHVIRHLRDRDTLRRLRAHNIEFVLPGCELGVAHADRWSEALGLVSNGTDLSAARRDKHLMIEAVGKSGLRVPAQCVSPALDRVLHWVRDHGRWPVVIKPLASGGSDGVALCRSEDEVTLAFERIFGRTNVLGMINDRVLVQEFLPGVEYVVDTVSYRGRHCVTGFWRYVTPFAREHAMGYDAMWLLPGRGERQDRLFEYARAVLDALGIRNGPAHCELKWVDGEPVLIEIGARLNGGTNCWINRHCGGVCQLDLTIQAYSAPDDFLDGVDHRYSLRKHAANVFLRPPVSGTLSGMPRVSELEALESLYAMSVSAKPGRPVPAVAGFVTLLHADRGVVAADLRRIRKLELHGLYDVAPST